MALKDYHASVGDWREQLRKNERKTRLVIAIFFAIYLAIGLLADMVILVNNYPNATLEQCLWALLSFRVWPYGTMIMLVVAVISLLITYSFYDRIMLLGTEYREITAETAQNLQEQQLYNVVEEMKVAAGLHFMPKVFLIEADYMNAFAAGYSEKSAMVAITRGLMEKLNRAEMQAVMSHELSHIRHHDIKLTLTVAILSNILLIVIDMLFYSSLYRRDRRNDNNNVLFMVIMLLRYLLPIITVVLALFLSRTREYMADAGAVELMRDNDPMARALLKIADDHQQHAEQYRHQYGETPHEQVRQASYLFDPSSIDPIKSLNNLFSTHPSLEQRLRALGFKPK
ncbi:zinc metalloprotease HtpX [Legionella jordanis]|uniref:Protease HtpX n=1 Tax=Legionella jordanis TaxID=456 RepID=A0A0W0VET8_9GAMM|nr:zinc metalloprotease HtpX [Legionella jordanis]KTD18631.1 heat shock protein HtpX [Legionella jordanis]RMX00859.1 zinc metalloprotease HtpX [Legionella jordanis]VEH11507.1 Zn-dependent protease with chaperone function [Legionella jordanis]HAT8715148.1 zinc metalloprotease HtpX [Legionella jordanis]